MQVQAAQIALLRAVEVDTRSIQILLRLIKFFRREGMQLMPRQPVSEQCDARISAERGHLAIITACCAINQLQLRPRKVSFLFFIKLGENLGEKCGLGLELKRSKQMLQPAYFVNQMILDGIGLLTEHLQTL